MASSVVNTLQTQVRQSAPSTQQQILVSSPAKSWSKAALLCQKVSPLSWLICLVSNKLTEEECLKTDDVTKLSLIPLA